MFSRTRYTRAALRQTHSDLIRATDENKRRQHSDLTGVCMSLVVVALSIALLAGISPKSRIGSGGASQQVASSEVATSKGPAAAVVR